MPHGLTGERTLMRIFIGEADKHEGRPLYEAILEHLRRRGYAGATVVREPYSVSRAPRSRISASKVPCRHDRRAPRPRPRP